jgi:hypothetical protein
MMTGVFAFASAGPAALSGLGGEGAVDFAIFLAFTFGGAGLGVNGAGVNSTGSMAAVLLKQACEVHPSNIACGELRQLHPASITDKLPMRSILMRFPSTAEFRSHFLRRTWLLTTGAIGSVLSNEWRQSEIQARPHRLNIGMCIGYGFWSDKARGHGLIAVPDVDASEVVFDPGADVWIECVFDAATHGPTTIAAARGCAR